MPHPNRKSMRVKRPRSESQSRDHVIDAKEKPSSSKCYRPGYFIAIRSHANPVTTSTSPIPPVTTNDSLTRRSVFSCWEDANNYMEGMTNGFECGYFERASDAFEFAFGNSTESCALYSSPFFLEELPQDTLSNIYSYICGHLFESVHLFISTSMGMTSKAMYQSCVRFVQQVPIAGPLAARQYMNNPETLSFFFENKAKIQELSMGCDKSSVATLCLFLFMLSNLDISLTKTLDLMHFKTYKSSAEEKWNLVRRGALPVDFVNRDINLQTFYGDVAEILKSKATSLVNVKMIVGMTKKYRWNQALVLENISHQVEDLSLYFYDGFESISLYTLEDVHFCHKLLEQITKMSQLKILRICTSWHVDTSYNIFSQSLERLELRDFEELGGSIFIDAGLECPSLKFLGMKVHLDSSFQPSFFATGCSYNTIEEAEIDFDSLGHRVSDEKDRNAKDTLEMLGRMPRLKKAKMSFQCKDWGPVSFNSQSVEDFTAHIFTQDLKLEVKSPSMKVVKLTFTYFTEFHPSAINIPNVEDLAIESDLDIEYDEEVVNRKLEILSQIIQKKMPEIKKLRLDIGEIPMARFKLRSESLREATLSILCSENVEVDCPLLDVLNGNKFEP